MKLNAQTSNKINKMDLVGMTLTAKRAKAKMTVLHRPGGIWHSTEVSKLVAGFRNTVCEHPQHPEHLILPEHRTKEEVLKVIGGGIAFTVMQVHGFNNPTLPWVPEFI